MEATYEFILSKIDPETGRLPDTACDLPDEEKINEPGSLRFAPGALDGTMGHHFGGENDKEFAEKFANLLVDFASTGNEQSREAIYEILLDNNLLSYIDDAMALAIDKGLPIEPYLHPFVRGLAKKSPDRGPVKFGIAVLGILRNKDDYETIFTLGMHEEFTLFTAVAIYDFCENPDFELYKLAQKVNGWGRIQLVERLAETEYEEIQAWLIREGYKNSIMYEYLAYTCAVAGRLDETLQMPFVDEATFKGAGEILEALIYGGPAQDINDYEKAAICIEHYLNHFPKFPKSVEGFLILHCIKNYLTEEWDEEARACNGWTTENRKIQISRINYFLDDKTWKDLVIEGLKSEDSRIFFRADAAAKKLGINTFKIYWQKLNTEPQNSSLWLSVMEHVNHKNIEELLEFASENLPLDKIASGPSEDLGLGEQYAAHSCLDAILQDLNAYPGLGKTLIMAGLQSPVVRGRNMALRALTSWSKQERDSDIDALLEQAFVEEPNKDVKERINKVLNYQPLDS